MTPTISFELSETDIDYCLNMAREAQTTIGAVRFAGVQHQVLVIFRGCR